MLERCQECRMRTDLCICKLIPTIKTKTRVIFLMHCYEFKKPSNTARLVSKALPNSETRLQGEIRKPLNLNGLIDPGRLTLMLFPEASGAPLTAKDVAAFKLPVTLLVPDGTWRQAKRIAGHASRILNVPRICAPLGAASKYQLRSADRGERLSTLEAVARVLGLLESEQVQSELESLMDEMVKRVLITRASRRKSTA